MHAEPGRRVAAWVPRTIIVALVFASGALFGSLATDKADAPRAEEVVRVSGADLAEPRQSPPAPEPSPQAGSAWSGRRVADEARAITAMIRGSRVYGTGIVIGERHVLTCLHVVEAMKTIELTVADRPAQRARVVAKDSALDLAVLETDGVNDKQARLGSVTEVATGDRVFGMGAPQKMAASFNSGVVSYVGRKYSDVFYLQTDVPTNSGNSGGPVLDESGRVIGVSSFILRDTQGLAFATPIDYAYQRFPEYFGSKLELDAFDAWLLALKAPAERAPPGAAATSGSFMNGADRR